jgi:hypothetical protein
MSALHQTPSHEKSTAQHVESIKPSGHETPVRSLEGRDPKWERKTIRKIDARLLIIRKSGSTFLMWGEIVDSADVRFSRFMLCY